MKRKVFLKFFCIFILIFLNLEILPSSSTYRINKNILEDSLEKTNYYNNLSISKYFNKYNASEIKPKERYIYHIYSQDKAKASLEDKRFEAVNSLLGIIPIHPFISSGLMNSSWPMYCHDSHHTGRSPYSTIDTWDEIWRFWTSGAAFSSAIDMDGIIYVGGRELYAIYPNGILKWKYDVPCHIEAAPSIDENGIIYVGTIWASPNYLFAIYSNGTLKWKYETGDVYSSPAIANDGTIIFGDSENWNIKALNPNGTVRWVYHANMVVYSSPAISDDIVYCGSHDNNLYALYLNNGTLKWKYQTGNWIRTSPCIGDDGTIYCVSLDNYLYALNPNGTLKWRTDVGAGTSPTIGQDGTIYCGYDKLYAINPANGSVKWAFPVGGTMRGGTPCNSFDGTIFVGTSDGGELIAINPDGTLKWRKSIGTCESAPAIGEDGVVYIGSSSEYFYAFGIGPLKAGATGPYYGLINMPMQFKGSASGGYSPYNYHWNFGDTQTSEEQNPIHTYTNPGNYTVTLTVNDNTGNTTSDTTWAWIQESNTPPNKPTIDGAINGNVGTSYPYTVSTSDPDENIIWYYIDWDDNTNTGWIGPYDSGTEITESHSWSEKGTYIIKVKAKDPYNAESLETTLEVTMPRSKAVCSSLFMKFLERFPILQKLLNFDL